MVQGLVIGVVLLVCVLFWFRKLAPGAYVSVCGAGAATLGRWGVLPGLRSRLERQAPPTGCGGGCAGCKDRGGGCH
ncbi:DUF6587 family protein [Acetobacter vaccinii]|uniref:Uncharacterized protein n=1 Tax=Acetobacter vaccinii TaxID=2592655 RepID=A0A5C1YMC6_9PROT|nr:DUF6587 family protein [Acetobacter vaccinii]QEO16668.1 hypothetical protein FLP30_01975 [Acetobacter vaccinii]